MHRRAALVLLLVAPFFGEVLSTATTPLTLLVPWNLAFVVALYGCGALLCREVARRARLGAWGLVLLGAAYAVYEEALADRFWFDPAYAEKTGVGDYSRVWDVSVLTATHLTAFHVAVSIGASIVVVERLFPEHRDEPWVGHAGLVVAALTLLAVPFVLLEDAPPAGAPQLVAAGALLVLLVAAAFVVPRTTRVRRPRAPGWTAFACTAAHFALTYTVPATGLPWPVGVLLAMAPVALGVALLWGCADPLRPMVGVLAFFALLATLVGLLGRYDLTAAGLATLVVLRCGRPLP